MELERQRFRTRRELIAIDTSGPQHKAIDIPANEVVRVDNGPLDGVRLVHIVWKDRHYLMFTQDLREQADMIESDD